MFPRITLLEQSAEGEKKRNAFIRKITEAGTN